MRKGWALLVALFLWFALSSRADAQDFERAKKHYMDAKKAQAAGKTDDAVREFIAAYEITKDPSLFKQIGQVYEQAGRNEEAAIYYRRYLSNSKEAADAADIKAKIATLEGRPADTTPPPPIEDDLGPGPGEEGTGDGDVMDLGADDTTTTETPPPPPPTFLDEGPRWQRTAAWVSVGVAAVLLTTGAVLGTSALAREDDVNRLLAPDEDGLPQTYQGAIREDYEDATDEGDMYSDWALYSFIGAGVCIAAATTFFILDAGRERPRRGAVTPATTTTSRRPILAPYITTDGGGIAAGWVF